MKKTYIIPMISIEVLEAAEIMLAGSQFVSGSDNQQITPTDEDYSGEFNVKDFGETIFDE